MVMRTSRACHRRRVEVQDYGAAGRKRLRAIENLIDAPASKRTVGVSSDRSNPPRNTLMTIRSVRVADGPNDIRL